MIESCLFNLNYQNMFFFDIINEQMQNLFDTLTVAVDIKINRLNNKFRQLLQANQFSSIFSKQTSIENKQFFLHQFRIKNWTSEKIEFFDFIVEDTKSVINFGKHVFYKNIYVFVNRFKNITSWQNKNKFKNIVSQCLRNTAFL